MGDVTLTTASVGDADGATPVHDDTLTRRIGADAEATFEEDVNVLEAQQRSLDDFRPVQCIDRWADRPPLLARRIMEDLISRERLAA